MRTKKITSANALKREWEGGGGEEIYFSVFLKRKMELLLIQTK